MSVTFEQLQEYIKMRKAQLDVAEECTRKEFMADFLQHYPLANDEKLQLYHAGLIDGLRWKRRQCIICKGSGTVTPWHPGDSTICMQCAGTGIDIHN